MEVNHQSTSTKSSLIRKSVDTPYPSSFRRIFFGILVDTIPTAVYLFSQFAIFVINLHFMSKNKSRIEVDGVGLGNTLLIAVHVSIVVGLNTGTSTFAAQAYGALNYQMVARYFHRAFILRLINLIPSYLLCFASYYVFVAMGVNNEVSHAAWVYCYHSFFAMLGFIFYDLLKGFIMAHNIFILPMISQTIIAIAHWFWCVLLVERFDYGINGVAYALAASEFSGAIILFIFVLVSKKFENTRIRPTKECLSGLWNQFKNEAYIASFIVLEWLAYECCNLIAGKFDQDRIAGQVFTYIIITLIMTPTVALSTIGTIHIASSLGQKNATKARAITKAIFLIGTLLFIIQAVLIFSLNKKIISFIAVEEQGVVFEATMAGLMVYFYFMPIDSFQIALTAILKGAGRARITAVLYVIALYGIGLSLAYTFGVSMQNYSKGIWYGMGIGICSMAAMGSFLLWKTDYNYQIIKIEKRLIEDESLQMLNEESFLNV